MQMEPPEDKALDESMTHHDRTRILVRNSPESLLLILESQNQCSTIKSIPISFLLHASHENALHSAPGDSAPLFHEILLNLLWPCLQKRSHWNTPSCPSIYSPEKPLASPHRFSENAKAISAPICTSTSLEFAVLPLSLALQIGNSSHRQEVSRT